MNIFMTTIQNHVIRSMHRFRGILIHNDPNNRFKPKNRASLVQTKYDTRMNLNKCLYKLRTRKQESSYYIFISVKGVVGEFACISRIR